MVTLRSGFTLLELSIVLVTVGLIVGVILVGKQLIGSAAVRAQLSQIQQYRQAAYTFKAKYGYLPGDIPEPDASNYGFSSRNGNPVWGNGDGVISGGCPSYCGYGIGAGEATMFWIDLTKAKLIDSSFSTATPGIYPSSVSGTNLSLYYPSAKIGRQNNLYIWSGGYYASGAAYPGDGKTYIGLSAITSIGATAWQVNSSPALTVLEASELDVKVDDGLPQSGKTQAFYINYAESSGLTCWAAGTGHGMNAGGLPNTAPTESSPTTCYDNGGVGGIQKYSLTQNNGTGINCALSFTIE